MENLGERTADDLRRVIEKLDNAWGPRETQSRAVLGPYTELVEIGRGGMGIVYRAWDTRSGRLVALKVPATDWIGEPALRLRFLREAKIAGALEHSGILPYFESGEFEGRFYIAGEYCDGPDLAAWLKRRTTPVPPKAAARLVAALAETVAYAHDRGVLHRDLKPSNVLLCGASDSSDPMGLSPRLTDFGLAKLVDPFEVDEDSAAQALTRSGLLLGSPPYMAPEQAAGTPSAIGSWTDVYGLGAILYEVLTGRPPFRGENPSETLRLAREADPIPVRVLRAGVPRALETITLKCLEKSPARRYASAALLADDLNRFLENRSILARPTSPRQRFRRWTRRRPLLAGLIAAGLVVLSLGVGGVVAWNLSLQKYNEVITRERERADQNVYDSNLQLAWKALEAGQLGRAQLILQDMTPTAGVVDRRDFTWGHLRLLSRREAQLISAEASEISGLCPSPDGRRIAVTDHEGSLRLVDMDEGETLWNHHWGRSVMVNTPAFSSDGRLVAVAVADNHGDPAREQCRVEVRSAGSGELHCLGSPRRAGRVEHVGFLDPDGLLAVATSSRRSPVAGDFRFAVWEIGRGPDDSPRLRSISRNLGWLQAAPDGASYAAPGPDGRPFLYDSKTNTPRLALAEAPGDLDGRAFFAPDGARVAMTRGNVAMIWETASGRLLHRVKGLAGPIREVAPAPGGDAILTREASQEVRLIDPSRDLNEQIFGPAGEEPGIETTRMTFSPDGEEFFVNRTVYMEPDRIQLRSAIDGGLVSETPGRQLGNLKSWWIQEGVAERPALIYGVRRHLWRWFWSPSPKAAPAERLAAHRDEIWGVEFSPDGLVWATAGNDTKEPYTVKLWDARTNQPIRVWKAHEAVVTDLSFSPDGRRLATSALAEANQVRVWELSTGRELATLQLPDHKPARVVCFDPTGARLIAAGNGGSLRVWDAHQLTTLWELRDATDRIHDADFSPSGDRVATASDLGFIRVYAAAAGALLSEFHSPVPALAVKYSPDGRFLAAADLEGSIFLFDAETDDLLRTIRSDDRQLFGLAFSPDGKSLAVGGHGRIARLYDPETGNELLSLEGHKARINGLAFSPDGLTLASADHEGVVYLWRAARAPSGQSVLIGAAWK